MASSDEEGELNKPLIDYGFEPVSRPSNFYAHEDETSDQYPFLQVNQESPHRAQNIESFTTGKTKH